MSNFWGKTLLEAKRVGSAISKSAKEVGGAIGEATSNIADHTKKSAKIAMLKAEMDQLYTKLGKAVFNYGMIEENEEALAIMKELLDKKSEMEIIEKELDKCEHDHACGHAGPCDCECDCEDCDEDCDCECHEEDDEPETDWCGPCWAPQFGNTKEADEDGTSEEDCQCDCEDEEECNCGCHKNTDAEIPESPENTKTNE